MQKCKQLEEVGKETILHVQMLSERYEKSMRDYSKLEKENGKIR